jgi:hypothetical protein
MRSLSDYNGSAQATMIWKHTAVSMSGTAGLRCSVISRRALFALAAVPRVRAARRYGAATPPSAERVLLVSPAPWNELARACRMRGLDAPVRVVARAHCAWWVHSSLLPDRWQAWIEFSDGTALVAECVPQDALQAERPERISAVTRAVAAALRRSGAAAAA